MKIEKVIIFSSQVEKQYQFYCDQLKFPCIEKDENFFCIKAGSSILQIQKNKDDHGSGYHLAFNIEPSLFLEAAAFLQRQEIQLLESENKVLIDFPHWNARSMYFRDAEQNILEYIARYNLPHHQHDRLFNPNDVLSISEIGVPVNDPREFISAIKSNTAIEIWKSYGQSFNAVGDEEGLLIVVPEKHKWFPTDTAAERLPTVISIKQDGNNFVYGNIKFAFTTHL